MISQQTLSLIKTASRVVFGLLFVATGTLHFTSTKMFLKIMPPYIPFHRFCVLFSGLAEITLGILLILPQTRKLGAWGLIALLIAVFPANIYLYQNQGLAPLPPLVHLLRLPFQAVLIAWAYLYTRD